MPGGAEPAHTRPRAQGELPDREPPSPLRRVLSNSFGFGGANCALLFGRGVDRRDEDARLACRGVGVLGPGTGRLGRAARGAAAGERAYAAARPCCRLPALLPPAERRRAGRIVKLALAVGAEAVARASEPMRAAAERVQPHRAAMAHNCHEICVALASREAREISPTRFTIRCTTPPPAIGASPPGEARHRPRCARRRQLRRRIARSAGAGGGGRAIAVLLVAYDAEYPPPLRAKRPIPDAFGVALVLTPHREPVRLARIEARSPHAEPCDSLPMQGSRRCAPRSRRTLPAAVAALASARAAAARFSSTLTVRTHSFEVQPCNSITPG